MLFTPLSLGDLERISHLQPEGWKDIVPAFEYSVKTPFFYPVKTERSGKIVGVGAAIQFKKTGWLAYIIVDKESRNQGIGYGIVTELQKILYEKEIHTSLLIATDLGKPVYEKAGFREVTDYIFMKREGAVPVTYARSEFIIPFEKRFHKSIIQLDKEISGENRQALIETFMENAILFVRNNKMEGYFLPDLNEGMIFAENDAAGLELMKVKYAATNKAVLPSENVIAMSFLKDNGFVPDGSKGTRMILGNDISWKPQRVYSRIGGNLG